ncbi:MAG: MoaD/ThiS family protein [Anaerolineales bacterium]|uniref:MoaD/ThiS family protein n=1 Tax=Candidatus Desulfolinea nitratireducens TaxID=2841698 RepID=A0A8J6TJJ1_9CHLR|nr:MoaD/ThiS family protein [Candidatus Desulfolinea nitratireducens]MBL6961372.1 MoaD/ThiS family protein [Anaerolineales bacterium]
MMKNTTTLILRNQKYEVKAGMTLLSALKKLEILPESVICVREGELLTEDNMLKDGETIKLVSVISGG